AVPAASCTVTPTANGVTITGEGFTAPRKLNDGNTTQSLNIVGGSFSVSRTQKNADYTVLAGQEGQNFAFVNCKKVAGKTGGGAQGNVQGNVG
ncbi:hypothetical protein, partial [Streptomyces sp. SID12501]